MILQKLKADAEAYLGETVDSRGHHRPRVLQRRPAPGDQGRRHGSPASTSSASSTSRRRPRWRTGSTRSPTRRSSSSTSAAARSTCRCSRSATASSRSSRPPVTTTSAATTSTRRSSTGSSAEFKRDQGIDLSQDPMALQRLYEAAEKAKIELSTAAGDADQPAVHHRRRLRAQAPRHAPHARQAQRADVADLLDRVVGPVRQAIDDAKDKGVTDDRARRARRRHDAHARRPGEGQGADRQGAPPRRQPRRGRRRRRRDPGRRARRRRQGRAAARRHPADARHRDQGRRDDQADRAQHDDPDAQGRGLLDRRGQPADGGDPRPAGRARDGAVQQVARQVPADRHPAGAARHPADRGRLRHRRQRHPQRVGQGSRHRQGAEDRDQGRLRPLRRRDQEHGLRRRVPRRGGPARARARRGAQQRPRTPPTRPRSSSASWASRSTPPPRPRSRRRSRRSARSLESEDPATINAKTEALQSAFHEVSEPMYQRAQEQAAPPAGATAPARRRRRGDAAEEEVVDAEVVDEPK